jgi:hypothetical protein
LEDFLTNLGLSGYKWTALISATLLGGCLHFDKPTIPPVIGGTSGPNPAGYTLADYNNDLACYNGTKTATGTTGTTPSCATSIDKRALRDKLVYSIVAEIDYAFGNFESKLFLNQGAFRVGSDFVSLGLAAASTISPAARTKTILSALIAGTTGTSLSLDKNFFQQQTIQALVSSMEANRDGIKTTILKQLQSFGVDKYPFEAARSDLIKYYFAGTLVSGLQRMHQDSATAAKTEGAALTAAQTNGVLTGITPEFAGAVGEINNILKADAAVAADVQNVVALFKSARVQDAASAATKQQITKTFAEQGFDSFTADRKADRLFSLWEMYIYNEIGDANFRKALDAEWKTITAKSKK